MKNILLLLFVLVFSACQSDDFEFPYDGDGRKVDIYVVKDMDYGQLPENVDLINLKLEEDPWLKHSEIEFYDWSSHIFYLKKKVNKEFLSGKYFVIMSGGAPILPGIFFPPHLSSVPMVPSIFYFSMFDKPVDIIGISGGVTQDFSPLENNIEFAEGLKNSGLLKEGIDVDLLSLKRISGTTLEYTYKVTNLDLEDIYIPDPEKMGDKRFSTYSRGVSIKQGEKHYWAFGFSYGRPERIEQEWYYKLPPASFITRTVRLDGYEDLPQGEVDASFTFSGTPIDEISNWRKGNGRIWGGRFPTKARLSLEP